MAFQLMTKPETRRDAAARVHCYICTHTVPAAVLVDRRSAIVKPGQKCARCGSSLDAAAVVEIDRAA
jgi:hypothetical protein